MQVVATDIGDMQKSEGGQNLLLPFPTHWLGGAGGPHLLGPIFVLPLAAPSFKLLVVGYTGLKTG